MSWLFSEYHLPPYYETQLWWPVYRTLLDAYREVRTVLVMWGEGE